MSKKKAARMSERARAIPTETELKLALEGSSKAAPNHATGHLNQITMGFASVAVAMIVAFLRDGRALRKRLPAGYRLPWESTNVDRILALLALAVCYCSVVFAFESKAAKRVLRSTYREQRRELISNWAYLWKHRRNIAFQYLVLFASIAMAAVAWRLVIGLTNCDSPIVVVLSGSMETAFYRGDLLFLTNSYSDPIIPGEIVVFKIQGRDVPIVHRCMHTHTFDNGTTLFLTKGDNNNGHDRSLYAQNQMWLERKHIMGRARFFLPYVGIVTVKLNEYPMAKTLVITVMVGLMLYTREL